MIKSLNCIHIFQNFTILKVSHYFKTLGDFLRDMKRYEEAIKMYNKAIEFDPNDSSY